MSQKSKAQLEQENAELRQQNKGLELTVTNLLKEIERLRDVGLAPVDSNIPQEEQIITKQINYFTALSQERALTLDETRALDLLLKNKRMIDDKKPKKNEDEVPEGTTEADLLRIVSNGEKTQIKKVRKRNKPKTSS